MEAHQSLKRVLGRWDLVGLGIGAIIGAGIFVLTGQAAAQYAGPGIVISFILSGIVSALAGLCYAELASSIPVAGSAYTYARASMGNFLAWVIGWDLILEYFFASATVAVGWSGYIVSFFRDFGIMIPDAFSKAPFSFDHVHGWQATGALLNIPAMHIPAEDFNIHQAEQALKFIQSLLPDHPEILDRRYQLFPDTEDTAHIEQLLEAHHVDFKKDILITNERHVSILQTKNFGRLAYVEVGAICVGKIVQSHPPEKPFQRGEEKGYFLFGGSTVILLGEPGAWSPDSDLLEQTSRGLETLVRLGEKIAQRRASF